MDWLHWLLYCALPAIAIALLFVGAFGPRLMAVAFALAVMAPLVLLRSVPVWPWSLPLHAVPPADWLVWGIAAAGLVGLGHDLRLWPQPLGGPPMVLLVLAVPWLLLAKARGAWSFEVALIHQTVACSVVAFAWLAFLQTGKSGAPLAGLLFGGLCLLGDTVVLRLAAEQTAWYLTSSGALVALVAFGVSLWRRPFVPGEGLWLVFALVHGGSVLLGHYQGRLPWAAALMLALAPTPLWLARRCSSMGAQGLGEPLPLAVAILAAGVCDAVAVLLLPR